MDFAAKVIKTQILVERSSEKHPAQEQGSTWNG